MLRLNRFVARSSGLSRRGADQAILDGRITVDGKKAETGQQVIGNEDIRLDDERLKATPQTQTILLNKPRGYVVSRDGQGACTVFELLPPEIRHLQPVGRLDKESSGLLLFTNDGDLAEQLTHPRNQKIKRYEVQLDRELAPLHRQMIAEFGVQLEDGPSKLSLERLRENDNHNWAVFMTEGRNRQIRRTFSSLGYRVTQLHRTSFGPYKIPSDLKPGQSIAVS